MPGATSYSFSGIAAPLTWVQPNPAFPVVDISAPATLTTAVAQTLRVTANSGYGCAPTTASVAVKAGYGVADLTVGPEVVMVGSEPTVCANSTLVFSLNETQTIGTTTELVWSCVNCSISPYSAGARYVTVVAPVGRSNFSVSVRYRDGCGNIQTPSFRNPTYNTSIFTEPYSINGLPCASPSSPRPVLYPNPAAGSLTAEYWQGDVRLYN